MAWKRKPIPPSSPGLTMKVMPTVTDKDLLYKQRLKDQWLKLVDRNTRYFFTIFREKRHKTQITSLVRQDGSKAETKQEIDIEAAILSTSSLGTSLLGEMVFDDECLAEGQLLDDQHRARLSVDFTESDVKDALWDMEDNKSS
ncbi:hypothetical protein Dimus_024047 [Dionaea muscipula]